MSDHKSISTKSGLKLLASQLPPIVFGIVTALITINPDLGACFALANGVIQAWGAFGQARMEELVNDMDEHKNEFDPEILKTDKFKAAFLNVLEMHMKETNEEKRKLLRNYLLSVGTGLLPDFNEHTKVIYTLNTITIEELKMLQLFGENGIISQFVQKNPQQRFSFYDLNSINHILSQSGRRDLIFPSTALGGIKGSDKYNQMLVSLGNKDLLWVASSDGFGSGLEAKAQGITEFGQTFLNFIRYDK